MRPLFAFFFLVFCTGSGRAMTYYMSPTGSDSAAGTSGAPWATPNHALNCGDTILASAGSYSALTNFGTVTCPANNNVAWLKCATFDGCKVSVTSGNQYYAGIQVSYSYWGVQGWEVSTSAGTGTCFFAYPNSSSANIHHIIFANDVANGCGNSGFQSASNGSAGVDYFAVLGVIAYNATKGSTFCDSGVNVFQPANADALSGTHIYVAGSLSYANVDPNPCNGTVPTDGQGFFVDTVQTYTGQIVFDNNLSLYNGGSGIKIYSNTASTPAVVVLRRNTTYGNETGSVTGAVCGEITLQSDNSTSVYGNLAVGSSASTCNPSGMPYAYGVVSVNGTDSISGNWGYSPVGNNTTGSGTGFSYGSNTFANPSLAAPSNPGAPSCGTSASVPACMATVIANFAPTNASAITYGYQAPSSISTYDPLYPQWLCNVTLPSGLVTPGCLVSSLGSSFNGAAAGGAVIR